MSGKLHRQKEHMLLMMMEHQFHMSYEFSFKELEPIYDIEVMMI